MEGWRDGREERGEARGIEARGGEPRRPAKQNCPPADQTGGSFWLTGAVSSSCFASWFVWKPTPAQV